MYEITATVLLMLDVVAATIISFSWFLHSHEIEVR